MGDYYKTKESVQKYIKLARGHDGATIIAELKNFLPEKAHVL